MTKTFYKLDCANVTAVLTVFMLNSEGIGLTEDELVKQSGLEENDVLKQVALLEYEEFVRSFICQEGSAGPYARRYKLVSDVTVKLEVSRPA
jgi:hypothetical protein